MRLFELLKEILDNGGIRYSESGGHIHLTLCSGLHKWSVCFSEDKESFLKYYARYPWKVGDDIRGRALSALNEMNAALRAGCFMLCDDYPVFRYGVYIFDEFTARESIADLLLTAAARTEAAWEQVYCAVGGKEVSDGI
ncbi:MAG: ATP-binding protein [Oscillospiraceae bacterium]